MLSLGIPAERISLTNFTVDNDWWIAQSERVDRAAVRAAWGATLDSSVVLFCAKLQSWKRPFDLLYGFAQAKVADAVLVFAGDGPLRAQLEEQAVCLGISGRVRFLGFVNQSQLPSVYAAADLMVLPSEYEPFAVVVNEASCCGCAVAASDRVGAARDLIAPVNPDLIYPCGNIEAMAALLRRTLADRANLAQMGRAARRHLSTWTYHESIAGALDAIQHARSHSSQR